MVEPVVPIVVLPGIGGEAGTVTQPIGGIGILPEAVEGALPGLITLPETLPVPVPPVSIADIVKEEAEAVVLPSLPRPEVVLTAASVGGNNFVFSGTALPQSDVAVYIHSSQALIYQSKADQNGVWSVTRTPRTRPNSRAVTMRSMRYPLIQKPESRVRPDRSRRSP